MLGQAVAVYNGKGGVGKTSVVANVAVAAAEEGHRVLVVDLDAQGNLGLDLGYRQRGDSDEGAALSQTLQFGHSLVLLRGVRQRVDVVPAGRYTQSLSVMLQGQGRSVPPDALLRVIAPVADAYDLILFDVAPGASVLGDLALAVTRGVVVPIKCDDGSLDGIQVLAHQFGEVKRTANPRLELFGIVLFDIDPRATAIRRQVMAELAAAFGADPPVFAATVRHSKRAAFDMRHEGLAAVEYERAAHEDRTNRLSMLRSGIDSLRSAPPARSRAAAGLASDYRLLTSEVIAKLGRGSVVGRST